MSERFAKKWDNNRRDETPFTDRIKDAVKPPVPLKPRLDFATRRIDLQVQKLDQANERFTQRDRAIFAKIVDAYTKHDSARANVFANELAEVRKMSKLIMNAKLALEQITLRLRTASELGDVVSSLGPAVGVLRSVRSGLCSVFPEAENELGEIGNMLSGIMIEAGQGSGMTLNFDAVNEDAAKILTEAATVAEQKIKDKFPDLPPGMPSTAPAAARAESTTEGY
ncbi:MAG: Snf7 family protein [Nitrososphaerota archaeon]|nr:Snf7 family protein [Nitrososphaerota archaeon]